MIAAYRLKGFGRFGTCTAIVLGFYLVSLQVASERKKLEHLDADIAATQRDIRALETEFDTRANMAQLERWNGDTLALAAPAPAQFLRSEAELASADVIRGPVAPGTSGVRTAALVVPSFVATPAPQKVQARAAPVAVEVAVARADAGPAARPVRAALARVAARMPIPRPTLTRAAFEPGAEPRARPQVALLDRKLLSDSTLRDLLGGARAEGGRLR